MACIQSRPVPSNSPSRPSHCSRSFRQSCLPTMRMCGRLHFIRPPHRLCCGASHRSLSQNNLALLTPVQAFISASHFIPYICSGTWICSISRPSLIRTFLLSLGGGVYANHLLDNACSESWFSCWQPARLSSSWH